MQSTDDRHITKKQLLFLGGTMGALLPFLLFITGVIVIALSGAPDEKGFWPVLLAALGLGLILSKDRKQYSEAVIAGMSEPIVMIMITAWILASSIGVLMTTTGFVDALTWIAAQLHLGGVGFVLASFLICCVVALSTGSSFATILICGPLLYPSGGLINAHLPSLAGAIIAGATFGDFFAPISDTTIASTLSQDAEIGATVKSRWKYVLPAFLIAVVAFTLSAWIQKGAMVATETSITGDPRGLPMLFIPAFIIYLFLKGKHLLHGLLLGLIVGIIWGLVFGLLPFEKVFSLDLENFGAKSILIDGINRAVGLSFFTILLMGLVGALKASGIMEQLVWFAAQKSHSASEAEGWIASTVGAAVLLTTHSIVAILMVADFAKQTGQDQGVTPRRRANILSLIVCVFPFLLPYFIPVILMANMTGSGEALGIPKVAPFQIGIHNFIAWGFLLMAGLAVWGGYGRKQD